METAENESERERERELLALRMRSHLVSYKTSAYDEHMQLPSSHSKYSPPEVDRIWLWVYHNKIPIYPIFYLLTG